MEILSMLSLWDSKTKRVFNTLPQEEDIMDQLIVKEINTESIKDDINSDDIGNSPDCAVVPDILACNEEVEEQHQEIDQVQNTEPQSQPQTLPQQ
ncbi:hypothetical protein FQN51_009400 [Onygenales sp. PD_10]|nr:hypothetical protein FQN51_009400 [Onygenales sp. PD_10]